MVNLAAVQSAKGFCVLVALLSASKLHPLLPFLFLSWQLLLWHRNPKKRSSCGVVSCAAFGSLGNLAKKNYLFRFLCRRRGEERRGEGGKKTNSQCVVVAVAAAEEQQDGWT